MISIPLAILSSLVALYFLGDTLNTMTLGGLALAVGILVDDSTVTIENTHRLLTEENMPLPAGDAARLGRYRRADAGLDACHQLRVHLGGLPRGAGKILVHPARARRCVRHARFLRPVAHLDAYHHRAAAQGRATRRVQGGSAQLVWPLPCRLRAPLRADAARLCPGAQALTQSAHHRAGRRRRRAGAGRSNVHAGRARLLSAHRRRS